MVDEVPAGDLLGRRLETAAVGAFRSLERYGLYLAGSDIAWHRGAEVRFTDGRHLVTISADWPERELCIALSRPGDPPVEVWTFRRLPRSPSTGVLKSRLAKVVPALDEALRAAP